MINWQDKDSLRRRGNPDVRAVEVHETPEWTGYTHPFTVLWSDGKLIHYCRNGMMWRNGEVSDLDVITAPRSGEGWIYPNIPQPSIFSERDSENQIKIRWEEVVE